LADFSPASAVEPGAGLPAPVGRIVGHERPDGAAVAVFGSGSAPAGHSLLAEAE